MDTLSAPLTIAFDYTRSLGPVLGRFMAGLRGGRVLGGRTSDGRVHVPPLEYDPGTHAPVTELVEVSPAGTVLSWTWTDRPLEGQPLDRPFGWALIRLDGADTALLHAVDAGGSDAMSTGMRVRIRWAAERIGHIRDIECFEPGEAGPDSGGDGADGAVVEIVTTPIRLHYRHSTSVEESGYLRGLAEGRIVGRRCPACRKVYVPPRVCPACGVATVDEVEVADRGTVTTFCVVNVPFAGQRLTPPYVVAQVLLDGADIPIPHLILGVPAAEVRMGLRVAAVWRDRADWTTTPENIDHFEPSGEADAPYETFAEHL
ncbi:OB-fold nucleic acid binding domain-containing protein [Actinoplanes sichuanensis]|uniref:Zn-ribbon domain-containing OB-fold protein n=1 Tax=Actinoplanes sichuanensis TaxID=512349 RepID=A0ABW4AM37_9ACTN|nr:OB-fold nucleic acid binding domain-containing protein [Actinoplanes sichuanensis]BEL08340.1 OB-fold nucleic acid binding domain-containing protein [Actinoplanes sichuanensis]